MKHLRINKRSSQSKIKRKPPIQSCPIRQAEEGSSDSAEAATEASSNATFGTYGAMMLLIIVTSVLYIYSHNTHMNRKDRSKPNGIHAANDRTAKVEGAFALEDPLLASFSDINVLNRDRLWPNDDQVQRALILAEAKERCRAAYFGAPKEGSQSSSKFRFPPAVGTRVFGFGEEGSKKGRTVQAGRWTRFWIVSTGSDGQILCNGGSNDVVTAEGNSDYTSSSIVFIPPPEDLYVIQLEAVPLTSASSFVAAAQMPDGAGFDDDEDKRTRPDAIAALRALDPLNPLSMRGVSQPANAYAGYRAYYGPENTAVSLANTKQSRAPSSTTTRLDGAVEVALNDGACYAPGTANTLPKNKTDRGLTGSAKYVATKVSVNRLFYVGYGVTEVQAYVRHPGIYDLCVAIVDSSASNGIHVNLSGNMAGVRLRGAIVGRDKNTETFDSGLILESEARSQANLSTLHLSNMAFNTEYLAQRNVLSEMLVARTQKIDSVFEADALAPTPTNSTAAIELGESHLAVRPAKYVFRCTVGTFSAKVGSKPTATPKTKPLCTSPISAFPDTVTYKNRYRLGSWVQLRDGICDADENCLVAQLGGTSSGLVDNRLPPGFVKAASQSTLLLLKTDGWIWLSDVCTMVFFHQEGIAEIILNGKWTSSLGSSLMKQPLSNFVEYRLGRPVMSNPFPVFMEELPKYARVKRMPNFFTYREFSVLLTNNTRRLPLAEEQGAGPSIYDVVNESSKMSLGTTDYLWLLQSLWGGCPSIVQGCPDQMKGMGGTLPKMTRHIEKRLDMIKGLYTGPDGSAIKSFLAGNTPDADGIAKLTQIINTIKDISPQLPHHFLLEFSVWRLPEDDVFLKQVADTLLKIDKAYRDLKAVTEWARDVVGFANVSNMSSVRKSQDMDNPAVPVDDATILIPDIPPPPLIIWHTRPATNLIDDNKEFLTQSRPSVSQLESHTDWTVMDALHNTKTGTRPAWEALQLSNETRSALRILARDNSNFVVIPRHEMTMPFHIGNRYGHFGMHYGSSKGMCCAGFGRPGYEMVKCLRKTWVDNMISELWLNAFVSHHESCK